MEKEIWKIIPGFEGRYEISNKARIRRTEDHYMMKTYVNENGYLCTRLWKKSKSKVSKVHRLMLKAFVGWKLGSVVNHKDGNKLNNSLDNLEWTTSSENNKHAYDTGLKSADYLKIEYRIQIDDIDYTALGAKKCAKYLHKHGYFLDVSEESLMAGLRRAALVHTPYMGKVKVENTADPYDEMKEYHRCGIKGRRIQAILPNGEVIEENGPAKLTDKLRSMGYLVDGKRDSMVKAISAAANEGYKCRGISVRFIDD